MIACQGLHWPDLHILKQNGYNTYGVLKFDSNIKMLMRGRCDYFPRGIHEVQLDFNKFNGTYGQLAIVENVLLKYPASVYFFVGKHNKLLAKRISKGLEKLNASGELTKLMLNSKNFNYDKSIELNPKLKVFKLNN